MKTRKWNFSFKDYTSKIYPVEYCPYANNLGFILNMQFRNLIMQIQKQYYNLINKEE